MTADEFLGIPSEETTNRAIIEGQSPQQALPAELPQEQTADEFLGIAQPSADEFLGIATTEAPTIQPSSTPQNTELQERIAGKSYYQDNDAAYTPIDTGENKFLEGVGASFQKPALGLFQRGLAAAEMKYGPEQTVPLTGGLTIQDLRGGGVDVANKFADEAAIAKARGEESYAVGELSGDVAKGVALLPAAGPVVGGAVAGGLYNFLAPETEERSPEEELSKAVIEGAKGATIGAVGGKVLGAAVKSKAALPTIGTVGGLMYASVADEGDEVEDAATGAAIGTAALATKKLPPEVTKYLSSKGSVIYDAVMQKGKSATEAVDEFVNKVETSAKEFGYGVRKLKDADEADMPITNIPAKTELKPEDQAILGNTIVGKLKAVQNRVSLTNAINSMYDRTLPFQQFEAKSLGLKGFTERMDAPLSSSIRTSSYIEPSISKAPYTDGWPVWRDDITYKEAIGSEGAIKFFNVVSLNFSKKSRLNPDSKVFGGTWMVPENSVSLDSMFKTFTKDLKVEPRKALQYVADLRMAEDWDKIAETPKRTGIYFKAIDEDGGTLGNFLDDRAAKAAFPYAEVKEVNGTHWVRVGVDGETKGVFESEKAAKSGTRYTISGDINEIRARIAEAQKESWAKPVEGLVKNYFQDALKSGAQKKVGLLSAAEFKAISSTYENFFPALKERYVKEATGSIRVTSNSTKKGVNFAKGSDAPLLDPLSQITAYTESFTKAMNKNIKLLDIAKLWEEVYKRNPKLWEETIATSYDDYIRQATGVKKKALDQATIDKLEEAGDMSPLMEKLVVGVDTDTKTVHFFNDGNKVVLELKDLDQIKSLEGLNLQLPKNIITDGSEAVKNLARYSVTSAPPFAVAQMVMDSMVAPLTSRTGQLPVIGLVQGALLSAHPKLNRFYKLNTGQGSTWGKLGQAKSAREVQKVLDNYTTDAKGFIEAWTDLGNAFGSNEKGAVKKASKVLFKKNVIPPIRGAMTLWEAPSNIGENAYRAQEFWRFQTKPNTTVAQAAVAAEEVTVPFKSKGADFYMNVINTHGLFVNAALQSTYRAVRYIKNNPGEATVKITAGIVTPAVIAQLYAIQDLGEAAYFNINEDIRNNNFIIAKVRLPEFVQKAMTKYEQTIGDATYIVLPGDPLFHKTFAAPVKALIHELYQGTGGAQLGAQMLKSLENATTPPSLLPYAVKVPMDIALNQKYNDTEIVPGYLQDKLERGQITKDQVFDEKTPMASRVLAKQIPGWTPLEVNYAINSAIGTTVWDIVGNLTEGPLRDIKGMEEAIPKKPGETFMWKRFFGGQTGSTKDMDSKFKLFNLTRNMKEDLGEYSNNLLLLESDDPALRRSAEDYFNDPKKATQIGIIEYWTDGIKQMQEYGIRHREVIADRAIDPKDKRRLLDELEKESNTYAIAFMDEFRNNKAWMSYYNNVYPRTKTALSPVFEFFGAKDVNVTPADAAKAGIKLGDKVKEVLPETPTKNEAPKDFFDKVSNKLFSDKVNPKGSLGVLNDMVNGSSR